MLMFLMFGAVLLILLIGVPTAATMGVVSVGTYVLMGGATLNTLMLLPQRMYAQVSGVTLMAIPFFLLMGNLMNVGGISNNLFSFASSCLGHRNGGLAKASVVACMLMAAMSGSAAACAAAIGIIAVEEMCKVGYDRSFTCATIASAGSLGPIIPPSLSLILFASLTQTSVNSLFAASAVPGVIIGLLFMAWTGYVSKKNNYGIMPRVSWKGRWQALKKAATAVFTPVLVLGGMFSGIFTPTEAAAVASFYVLIVGMFVHKTIKLKDLPGILWKTSKDSAAIMFVIALASYFQYVISYARIPQQAIALITSAFTSMTPVLLIFILLLLIMGCFLEGTAIQLITVPIFVPLAEAYGYSVVQLSSVFVIACCVGVLTPPVGLNLYVMGGLANEKIMNIAKHCIPYVIIMLVVCLLVAFIPPLSLWLPSIIK